MSNYTKRIWIKNNTAMKLANDTLTVWDSGDMRYERLSNGQEHSWKLIDRQMTDTGFIEILEERPLHDTPSKIVWKDTMPVILERGGFQIPGWVVKNVSGINCRS